MAPQTVSKDRKALIPHLYHTKRLKVRRICEYLRVKKTCVYNAFKYHRRFGVPWNIHARRPGQHRKMSYIHLNFIYHFLQENPCTYVDELQDIIRDRCGVHVSFQTSTSPSKPSSELSAICTTHTRQFLRGPLSVTRSSALSLRFRLEN